MVNTLVDDRLLFTLVLVAITVRDTFITILHYVCVGKKAALHYH